MSFSSNFPLGSGKCIYLSKNIIKVNPIKDPVTNKFTIGYDYYFNFYIKNHSNKTKNILIYVLRDNSKKIKDWNSSNAPLFFSKNNLNWFLVKEVKSANNNRDYKINISIKPNEKIFISNNISLKPSFLKKKLILIANENNKYIKYQEIGKSVDKRAISAIEINFNKKKKNDRFLIWSGIHPSEPDVYSTLSIIKWLISDDKDAIEIRNNFIFDIIPVINPDGFQLGTNGCNKNGINIYWDFFGNTKEKCPESYYLWNFILKNPPQIALDIHSYIYQTNKNSRPYIFPIKFYPVQLRYIAWKFQKSIISLNNNNALDGKTVYFKNTLGPTLIKKFGTLTLQGYHLHLADGPKIFKKKSIDTIKFIHNSIKKFLPLHSKNIYYYKYDINGILWTIFEKFFDRLPRKVIKYFIKNKERNPISTSIKWKKYYNIKKEINLE